MPERHILGWHILLTLTWIYPTLHMHSYVEGYPGFFKILAFMNNAAVHNSILVWICDKFSKQLSQYESMTVGFHCLALENTAQMCCKVAVCTYQQQWGRLLFPHPPAVDIVIYMEFNSPKRCGVTSHDFNLLFLNSMFFKSNCYIYYQYIFYGQVSVQILTQFFMGLF